MKYLSTAWYIASDSSFAEKREIFDGLLDIRGEGGADMLEILEQSGRYVPTPNKEYYNYSADWLYNTAKLNGTIGSQTAGAVGVNVTVDSTAMIHAGMQFMDKNGNIGYVQSVTNSTVFVANFVDAFGLTDDDLITFPSNAIPEGSSQADGIQADWIKKSNKVQIFENADSVTDLHSAGRTVVKMPNGKMAVWYKLQHDTLLKHRIDIANAFIVGKYGTAKTAAGKDVPLTRGLNSYIADQGGVSDNAAVTGTVTRADWKGFSRLLDLARSPKKGFLWCGADIGNALDDLFIDELAAGGIDYGSFGLGSDAAKVVDMGVNGFKIYGRHYLKSNLAALDHPNVTAATDFVFPSYAYFVPSGKIKTQDGKMVDRIRGRYLEMSNGINGRFVEKNLGGLAEGGATERTNKIEFSYTSYEGLEFNAPQHGGRFNLTQA
jgi:hypothetical protein